MKPSRIADRQCTVHVTNLNTLRIPKTWVNISAFDKEELSSTNTSGCLWKELRHPLRPFLSLERDKSHFPHQPRHMLSNQPAPPEVLRSSRITERREGSLNEKERRQAAHPHTVISFQLRPRRHLEQTRRNYRTGFSGSAREFKAATGTCWLRPIISIITIFLYYNH